MKKIIGSMLLLSGSVLFIINIKNQINRYIINSYYYDKLLNFEVKNGIAKNLHPTGCYERDSLYFVITDEMSRYYNNSSHSEKYSNSISNIADQYLSSIDSTYAYCQLDSIQFEWPFFPTHLQNNKAKIFQKIFQLYNAMKSSYEYESLKNSSINRLNQLKLNPILLCDTSKSKKTANLVLQYPISSNSMISHCNKLEHQIQFKYKNQTIEIENNKLQLPFKISKKQNAKLEISYSYN